MTKTKTKAAHAAKVHFSKSSSIDTVYSLVRAGVGELCHVRGLFTEDCFESIAVPGLEGIKPHILRTGPDASEEANSVMAWLQDSLHDAMQRGYVTKFVFGVCRDAEATRPLEEYIFRFEKDPAGNIRCKLPGPGVKPTIETARKQIVKLLRAMVSVSKTLALDEVPPVRWLFAKMEYHDQTPADYEPPHFVAAGDRAVGWFDEKPLVLKFGDLTTPYDSVGCEVRSVLDSVEVVPGMGPTAEDASRLQTTRGGEWTGNDAFGAVQDDDDTAAQRLHANTAELFSEPQPAGGRSLAATASAAGPPAPPSVHDHARAVERWAAGRGCVSLLDAVQRFPGIQVAALRQAMALLAARGALLPTRGQDAYDVPDRPLLDSDEEGEGEEGADVGARLGALPVGAARLAAHPVDGAPNARARRRRRRGRRGRGRGRGGRHV